jgi:hypothetical protein
MSAEAMIVLILVMSLVAAGLVPLWAGRSRLGSYEGRHRR